MKNFYFCCSFIGCRDKSGRRSLLVVPASSPPNVFLNLKCSRCRRKIHFKPGRK